MPGHRVVGVGGEADEAGRPHDGGAEPRRPERHDEQLGADDVDAGALVDGVAVAEHAGQVVGRVRHDQDRCRSASATGDPPQAATSGEVEAGEEVARRRGGLQAERRGEGADDAPGCDAEVPEVLERHGAVRAWRAAHRRRRRRAARGRSVGVGRPSRRCSRTWRGVEASRSSPRTTSVTPCAASSTTTARL